MQTNIEIVPKLGTDIRRTFKLFWPLCLGQIATTSMAVVDTVMSGLAGTIELSGVAIGSSFFWPTMLFIVGCTLTIQPLISHLRGAGRSNDIPRQVHMATVIVLLISVLIGALVMALPLIYHFIPDINQDMVRVGQGYLIAIGFAMPAFAMFNILRAYWEGLGNTLPTFVFGFVALGLNIPLNYLFIFGGLGIPAMGGIGCGIATTATVYLTVIIMLIYVSKSKSFEQYRIYTKFYSFTKQEAKDFLRFALPLAFSTTIEVTCFSLVALLLSPFGPTVVASHSIAINIGGLVYILPLAIGSAATVRVGEAMGAGHWRRAQQASLAAILLGLMFFVFTFCLLIFAREQLISFYTEDSYVIALASGLLLLCAVYQLPDTIQVIAIGVLRGFKDSKTIFINTVISYWVIGMPVGYTLAYGYFTDEPMMAAGFWIGFISALTAACILYLARMYHLFKHHILPPHLKHSMEVTAEALKIKE